MRPLAHGISNLHFIMDVKLGFLSFMVLHNLVALSLVRVAQCSEDVMRDITNAFEKIVKECSLEEGLSDTTMVDFYNYWKEDYALLNRDFGCAILCVSKKFDLLTPDHKVHHKNTKEFVMAFGGDESMAKQLVDMIHTCEKQHDAIADHCARVLEVAKCFRTKTHELKWAPKMEQIIGEIITEM